MTAQRTIIDILRKGNQELFHSSMIAWLLDPKGEHGFGSCFLERFADLLANRGWSEMKSALQGEAHPSVATETTTYKGRYDIVVTIGRSTVIIENKTKSLGAFPQFERYKDQAAVLVALGLADISFDQQVRATFPVVTYHDILALLDSLGEPAITDFGILARHYRNYLHRELDILDQLDAWAISGSNEIVANIRCTVDSIPGFTKNDGRFLNLFHLERFRNFLSEQPRWTAWRLESDKNMRSGVWLSLSAPSQAQCSFRFDDGIHDFCVNNSAELWFHIELWDGVLTSTDEGVAGTIQIRCHSKMSNLQVMKAFRVCCVPNNDEWFSSQVQDKFDTFYLMGRPLLRKHLPHQSLESVLESFMCRFGSFSSINPDRPSG